MHPGRLCAPQVAGLPYPGSDLPITIICSMQSVAGIARSVALPHCLRQSPSRLVKRCIGTSPKRACIMAAGKCVEFSKYQGLGNDFILVRSRNVS